MTMYYLFWQDKDKACGNIVVMDTYQKQNKNKYSQSVLKEQVLNS